MTKKQKLELTWVGKENRPRLEPRILIEDPAKSYHAASRVSENDIFENVLIHGDNLLALKALEADYAGKVKCVFIDPPYNTGSAFAQYDDGLEHSIWLGLMRDRLEIIRRLLSDDGSLWVTLDDNESHYMKVMCDEIFGRANFMANVIWEKADSPRMDARFFSTRHDNLLVFAKNVECLKINHVVNEDAETPSHYNKVDKDGRKYYLKPLRAMGVDGTREARPSMYFPLTAPDGTAVYPKNPDGSDSRWRWSPDRVERELWRIEWVNGRSGWSANFRIYADDNDTRPPETIWTHSFAGSNRHAKSEAKGYIEGARPFDTPKPERLLSRVLQIATDPGDIVLDSFAGSGTTGAVAHKMGRRWIMVELEETCSTHIVPRLRKVIDGSDQGGISKAVEWQGGGGFRYYDLGPSLLDTDKWGREVISKKYDAAMLAQALCKLEGFTYAPSPDVWWQQGYSSETDFLYVTTQTLGQDELAALSDDVGDGRSLLVLCAAWRGNADAFSNLTLRKIPNHIRDKCEWGHDDYSLNVANLPMAEVQTKLAPVQGGLFDGESHA